MMALRVQGLSLLWSGMVIDLISGIFAYTPCSYLGDGLNRRGRWRHAELNKVISLNKEKRLAL